MLKIVLRLGMANSSIRLMFQITIAISKWTTNKKKYRKSKTIENVSRFVPVLSDYKWKKLSSSTEDRLDEILN